MNIELCDRCIGKGELSIIDITYDAKVMSCNKCGGTGRVYTRTYKYEVPVNSDVNLIYYADEKILGIIKELEKNI